MRTTRMVLFIIVLCMGTTVGFADSNGVRVMWGHGELESPVKAQIVNGRTMVPLRSIFEALGYKVQWIADMNLASCVKNSTEVIVSLGDAEISRMNWGTGEEKSVMTDSPATLINGSIFVPLRAIAEITNEEVVWYKETRTACIGNIAILDYEKQNLNLVSLLDGPYTKGHHKIAAGGTHYLQINDNKTVSGVGANNYGQISIPAGLSDVVDIAAGRFHSLALKSDGTVVAWGSNEKGQINVPTGLKDVIAIAAGDTHSLALQKDGHVIMWGYDKANTVGEIEGLKNVVKIATGGSRSYALIEDGSVVSWSSNGSCFLEFLNDVTDIAAGTGHIIALMKDGSVASKGDNIDGQCNVPVNLMDVLKIAAGEDHSVALKKDGTVIAWGYSRDDRTNVPTGLTNVVEISAKGLYSIALKKDGSVVKWGTLGFSEISPVSPSGDSHIK